MQPNNYDLIARSFDTSQTSVTVDAAVADAELVEYQKYAGGSVVVPAGSSLTTLTFYVSHDRATFVPLYDQDGVAVTLTVSAECGYALPDALFGAPFFKIKGNADGVVSIFRKG